MKIGDVHLSRQAANWCMRGAGAVLLAVLMGWSPYRTTAQAPPPAYANFEGSQTNPVRLSADGSRLFAVNTANGSLSVFDVKQPASPKLIAEIPVGIEPVSVNPRTNDEVWVVNQASNSISVVYVSRHIVADTINLISLSKPGTPLAEPMDVVFANNQAYVTVSRTSIVAVIDPIKYTLITAIPVYGGNPRALAVSPDGNTVYAAFGLSGNGTTIIPASAAPPQPPPTNPSLPPPPHVGLIVAAADPAWKQAVPFTMPDNDVVAIHTGAAPSVKGYYSGVGTNNLGIAVNPVTGDLYVANTDSLNLTRFETNLQGHFVNNRISRIEVASGQVTPFDLNPNIDYRILPNPAALATALAQPAGVVFDPSGAFMYVAAFGTDRVAKVDAGGNVLSFVEVSLPGGSGSNVDPANKRGPRGLALNSGAQTLYSLNRISNTISVIDTSRNAVAGEVPVGNDPTPAAVKAGRGFLYDAKLAGNGTGSCAACHIDGDRDHLGWDLGDPGGDMTSTVQRGKTILFHPMKGPMTTQPLRGLLNLSPYHWRGDKPDLAAFNAAFPALMGGPQISDADMATYDIFLNSILYLPNPYQQLDRTLPNALAGGFPNQGRTDFLTLHKTGARNSTCNRCHEANPGPGSNRIIDLNQAQPIKMPQLRSVYQKLLYTAFSPTSIDGFGMSSDGHSDAFQSFFNDPSFAKYTQREKTDIAAYQICFDTGTAPAVGYARTVRASNLGQKAILSDWNTLQAQAAAGDIDLVGRGTIKGHLHGLLYQPDSANYITDTNAVYTQAQLQAFVEGGDTLTVMGMYPGTGLATAPR